MANNEKAISITNEENGLIEKITGDHRCRTDIVTPNGKITGWGRGVTVSEAAEKSQADASEKYHNSR